DKDYGYLTSCPTNTGTGLRASFMIHLPMLEKTGHIKNVLNTVTKFGVTLRGIHGEGTEPLGHIFQVSNQVTMGKPETEIIGALKNVTAQIMQSENELRRKFFKEKKLDMVDRIYRSYGTLKHARTMSGKEAMELLSSVRLGYMLKILDEPKPNLTIYQIMMNIQRGSLIVAAKKDLTDLERDTARADYLRGVFS
ncbi:MAG: ATP--guanido phosphotransferase, partial [Clostridiales bacterium]|nr:ATP--guanido phosphotransferase [Clostridiales bacterium]